MDERQKDEAPVEQDDRVKDLEVEAKDAEKVKGGAASTFGQRDGVDGQHNETLLRS